MGRSVKLQVNVSGVNKIFARQQSRDCRTGRVIYFYFFFIIKYKRPRFYDAGF